MTKIAVATVAVVAFLAVSTSAVEAGASMGGKAKNSYSALMCEQEPSSWFCITNARRENLIKLKREGCTSMECPNTHSYKKDAASLTCKSMKAPTSTTQHTCDPVKDIETCCDKRMQCSDWKPDGITFGCPYGYEPIPNAAEEMCIGPQCSFTDVGTCCKVIEPMCTPVVFADTAGENPTDKRTCRKMQDREGDHDGDHTTNDSFLGWTNSEMECFQLKTSQRSAMETTRIPNMPGPPESGKSYGKPAPRPTALVGNARVVIDQSAREGGEAKLCKGYNCENGGEPNASSDNQWQEYLDISWNSFTGECHSCLPEKTLKDSAGETITDPSAFRVSRAGQLNSVTGDVNAKPAYPCKAHRGEVMNQVGGYEKDKDGNIIEQTGVGKTDAGRDASNKVVGEATHANFQADQECVNEPLDEKAVSYDKVYDCNCPRGHYILNMRCVKFLSSGGFVDEAKKEYEKGKECLPSYGTRGKLNKQGKEKKVLSMNKYFPCDASKAVCADGSCVDLSDVSWDCDTGFPCAPGQESCKLMDSCNVCGGNGLSCHAEECETCYKNFKAAHHCSLADDVDLHIKGDLQLAKDGLELAKWKCKSGKTQAIRDTNCASMQEGGAAMVELLAQEAEVEAKMKIVEDKVAEMASDSAVCPMAKCWKQVKNDCGRPDVCKEDVAAMLTGTYGAEGNHSYKDSASYEGENDILRTMKSIGTAVEAFKSSGCAVGESLKAAQEGAAAEVEAKKLGAEAAKEAGALTAKVGGNEEFCAPKCPEATEDMDEAAKCAVCCPLQGGVCVDELTAEANRDARIALHEEEMVKVRAAEAEVKDAEDKVTKLRLEYTYDIQKQVDIKFWGCISQLSGAAC